MKHLSPAEIETIRVPEPKHDPFTLESLVAWLEKTPEDAVYCYLDHGRCLLGQYFSASAFERPLVYSNCCFDHGPASTRRHNCYPEIFNDIAIEYPHTFSAALTRARAALASQKGNANG